MNVKNRVDNLWERMNNALNNIHSDKKIKPTDFLWKIQKWAYFGNLWNPKPMNYCPYYWMGIFTTIMTFMIPIIPICHIFYYIGIGTKNIFLYIFDKIDNLLNKISIPINRVFNKIGNYFDKIGDYFEKIFNRYVSPIKEKKKEQKKAEYKKRPIDDFILYYLLTKTFFEDENSKKDVDVWEIVKKEFNKYKDLKFNFQLDINKIISKRLYDELTDIDFSYKERDIKTRHKNVEIVQEWINGNPDWFKLFSKYLKSRYEDYKWRYEWSIVKDTIEYDDATDYKKFKKFNKEIVELEKLKRKNKIVANIINYTKIFVKCVLGIIALVLLSVIVYYLSNLGVATWKLVGLYSLTITIICGIGIGLYYLVAYIVSYDYKISRFFNKIWNKMKIVKIIFLPLILLIKIITNTFGMLLDWKKDNCPQIIYEDFDE